MWLKIKSICYSPSNVFAIAISLFAFLSDVHELITGFSTHLWIVIVVFLFIFITLTIHLFLIDSNNKTPKEIVSDKEIISKNGNKNSKYVSYFSLSRILFSGLIFISIMTIGSLFYIKNKGIYYVVLQENLTINQAAQLKNRLNNNSLFKTQDLSCRIIYNSKSGYEIILSRGYLSYDKALQESLKIPHSLFIKRPHIVGPQKITNFKNKLKYIQADLFQ